MERKQFTCNSFVFYGSFYEAIRLLPLENQAKIYDAIFKFAFENVEVELEGIELAVFLLIKPQLIANRVKYENGKQGGRPRKGVSEEKPTENGDYFDSDKNNKNLSETETKPKQNQNETETKPNNNQNIGNMQLNENLSKTETKPNVNVNGNVNDNVNGNVNEDVVKQTTKKRFVKPTLEEITAYCNERNNNINPKKFYDFYESKGWRIGITPMKDWKACIRNWEISEQPKGKTKVIAKKYDREE